MAVFKNYNFEYNAQRVDLFKSTVVCSYASDIDLFKEGSPLEIPAAGFYGVITNANNSGARLSFDIVAESWGRELRNNVVTEYQEFRQVDAVTLVKHHLLPDGWDFEYPEDLDTHPRYISYILRNGTFLSHIGTIMDVLGLDFTIYSAKESGVLVKKIKAYYRDVFEGRDVLVASENRTIGNLSVTVDYGKIATSIVCLGAESEQGVNQVWMDAEMGNWSQVPHVLEIKDTTLKKPEFATDSNYFWYFPASPDNPDIDLLSPGDIVTIDSERMMIKSLHFLSSIWVASLEAGLITEAKVASYFEPLTNYVASGVIVASLDTAATFYLESVNHDLTLTKRENLSNYGEAKAIHAIYDDILISNFKVTFSNYLTFDKNLPARRGFIWIGSEKIYYDSCASYQVGSYYEMTQAVRGVPTCATASCQHCGSREEIPHIGWSYGCPYFKSDSTKWAIELCPLGKNIAKMFTPALTVATQCPLCFDNDSVCPAMKCPQMKNDVEFKALCPKGLTQSEITYTPRYQHHRDTIVFPSEYYYDDNGNDVYEMYARDSMIAKYGYLPTQVSAKGIADMDSLDKLAEGRLRLSAVPVVGTCTLFNFDPWVVPASAFPGDVIEITAFTRGRYDIKTASWYPTYWFDVSSTDPKNPDTWMEVGTSPASWVKYKQKFVIQKTVKSQRGMPEITFGAGDIGFQSVLEYINETSDTTSQRHRNQDPSRIIQSSENGLAAKVQNIKTGEQIWVRMVK